MCARALGIALGLLGLASAGVGHAAETVVLNDSTVGGTPSTVANVFVVGEAPASWLTATCTGDIVAARIYWASMFGGASSQLEQDITFHSPGTFPSPSGVLTNQGGGNATISAPTLFDGVMNEYRFLDPPTNTVPLRIAVTSGQTFVVALRLFNQSSGNPFAPSVVYDQDGCQTGRNAVDVVPGGWSDACLLGVTGDWVIRAVIDCDEPAPLPASGEPGRAALALLLLASGCGIALVLRSRRSAQVPTRR